MKKLVLYIIYLSLGLFLASCAKEFIMEDEASGTIVIEATQEGWDTKTSVDGETGRVYWSPSDEISVFFSEAGVKFISQNKAKTGSASFVGSAPSGISGMMMDYIYGLYPYDAQARFDGQSLKTTMPSEQEAAEGTFADGTFITVAKAPRTSPSMGFYNVCGGIRFQVPVEGVRYVTLKGNGGETLAGNISVRFNEAGIPEVSDISDAKTEIILTADGDFKPGVWYYFVTVPVNLSQGFTLSFSNGHEVCTYEKTDPVTISRSVFGSLDFSGFDPQWVPEAVVIPDPAFLNYCLDNFDMDGDGVLTVDEAENVYYIDVETSDIHSLKGIEKFSNLNYLYCYGLQEYDDDTYEYVSTGKLESLDLRGNPNLTYLYCYYNQLTSLDVSKNTALTDLDCGGNQLTSLDLSNNTSLRELYCQSNQISSLDVSECPDLQSLQINGNPIPEIDLSNNSKLESLAISSVTVLDCSMFPDLTYLNCNGCPLESIDVSSNTKLRDFYYYDCPLESLDVSKNLNLRNFGSNGDKLRTIWIPAADFPYSYFYHDYGVAVLPKIDDASAGSNESFSIDSESEWD